MIDRTFLTLKETSSTNPNCSRHVNEYDIQGDTPTTQDESKTMSTTCAYVERDQYEYIHVFLVHIL